MIVIWYLDICVDLFSLVFIQIVWCMHKSTNNMILFTIITILTVITIVTCDTCITYEKGFQNATQLISNSHDLDINAHFDINNTNVDTFLEGCSFEPMPNLLTRSLCGKACALHVPCLAYVNNDIIASSTGCKLCVNETRRTDTYAMGYPYGDIMIDLQSFRKHIIGDVLIIWLLRVYAFMYSKRGL